MAERTYIRVLEGGSIALFTPEGVTHIITAERALEWTRDPWFRGALDAAALEAFPDMPVPYTLTEESRGDQ